MGDLRIQSARIHPYRIRLSASAGSKYGIHRVGRLVELTSHTGLKGWGDAAPLPGFSPETVADLDRAWPAMQTSLITDGIPSSEESAPSLPSLRFALEQASLTMEGRRSGKSPADLIDPDHRARVQVAGLVDAAPDEAVGLCEALHKRGYRAIKVKTAGWSRADALVFFGSIRRIVPTETGIHLDANRDWSFDEAAFILESAADAAITYVEEPLANPAELPRLADRVSIPIGLDESLVSIRPDMLSSMSFARYVILKPTILGGIDRTVRFARSADSAGMTPVVSSTFESGIGMMWLLALAASSSFEGPAGLDTLRSLETDVLARPVKPGFELPVSMTGRVYDEPIVRA